jgi:hypothetical protein
LTVETGPERNCNETGIKKNEIRTNPERSFTVTFSAKIERFTENSACQRQKYFKKIAAKSPWNFTMFSAISHDGVLAGKCRNFPGYSKWSPVLLLQSWTWVVYSVPHGTLSTVTFLIIQIRQNKLINMFHIPKWGDINSNNPLKNKKINNSFQTGPARPKSAGFLTSII